MYDKNDNDFSQMRDQFDLFLNILLIILFSQKTKVSYYLTRLIILDEVLSDDVCSFHNSKRWLKITDGQDMKIARALYLLWVWRWPLTDLIISQTIENMSSYTICPLLRISDIWQIGLIFLTGVSLKLGCQINFMKNIKSWWWQQSNKENNLINFKMKLKMH